MNNNIGYILMWVVTIAALLMLARVNLNYSLILALGLALFYAVKYFNAKRKS